MDPRKEQRTSATATSEKQEVELSSAETLRGMKANVDIIPDPSDSDVNDRTPFDKGRGPCWQRCGGRRECE